MALAYHALKKLKGHNGAIYKLLDTKNNFFYSCGGDGFIVKWWKDISKEDGLLLARTESPIYTAMLYDEEQYLIAGCLDGSVILIDLRSNAIVKNVKAHQKSVHGLACFQDKIFSCASDGVLNVYTHDLSIIVKIQITNQALRCMLKHESSQSIFIGASDHHLYQMDINTYAILKSLEAHESSVFSMLLKDEIIYTGGRDAKLKAWQLPSLSLITSIDAHLYSINEVLNYRDIIITASRDKNIRLWDEDLSLIQSLSPIHGGHINSVNTLTCLSGTNYFASGSDDKSIIIWGLE